MTKLWRKASGRFISQVSNIEREPHRLPDFNELLGARAVMSFPDPILRYSLGVVGVYSALPGHAVTSSQTDLAWDFSHRGGDRSYCELRGNPPMRPSGRENAHPDASCREDS